MVCLAYDPSDVLYDGLRYSRSNLCHRIQNHLMQISANLPNIGLKIVENSAKNEINGTLEAKPSLAGQTLEAVLQTDQQTLTSRDSVALHTVSKYLHDTSKHVKRIKHKFKNSEMFKNMNLRHSKQKSHTKISTDEDDYDSGAMLDPNSATNYFNVINEYNYTYDVGDMHNARTASAKQRVKSTNKYKFKLSRGSLENQTYLGTQSTMGSQTRSKPNHQRFSSKVNEGSRLGGYTAKQRIMTAVGKHRKSNSIIPKFQGNKSQRQGSAKQLKTDYHS